MGGDFKVIIWGTNHKGVRPFLMGAVDLETPAPSKDFHLAIGGGLKLGEIDKKWLGKGIIFHAIIPAL